MIEAESVCVKLWRDGVVRSGSDCSAVVPSYSGEVRRRAALASDDVFLLAGDGGILFSSDGFSWEQVPLPNLP